MKLVHVLTGTLVSLLVATSVAFAQAKLEPLNTFDDASTATVDHAPWAEFLSKYIRNTEDNRTLVDYGAVPEEDKLALKAYLTALQAVDPTVLNRDEAFAYWVNLYNALTVDIILDDYPVKSIRNIFSGFRPGPWRRTVATVNGVTVTLDNIEHGILRRFWSDNRVHYAVNCASIGCPNLAAVPYTGATLDDMLDKGARDYVNHPRGVNFDGGRTTVSSIYSWFREDFGDNEAGVIAHLKQYAEPELLAKLDTITGIDANFYDWNLNDAKSDS